MKSLQFYHFLLIHLFSMDQKPQSIFSRSQWKCPICQFLNYSFLDSCHICSTKKLQEFKKSPDVKHYEKIQKKEPKNDDKDEKQIQTIVCQKCQAKNLSDFIKCTNCNIKLKKKAKKPPKDPKVPQAPILKPPIKTGPNFCYICQAYKKVTKKGKGFITECKCVDLDDLLPPIKSFCNFCFQELNKGEYGSHIKECKEREEFYNPQSKSFERCTELQIDIIMYMTKNSEQVHFVKQAKLLKKIQNLGYTLKDLENLYFYIVNLAPIIIHMHADKHFGFYLNDTHYRNQFETAKSSGCTNLSVRGGWEDSMFDSLYKKAEPYERVKYGTMNFTNDPHGVSVCTGYGKSYFLLKEHVRNRCTMTDHDQTMICTFRFCYQLLVSFTENEIRAAIEAAKAQEVKSEGVITAYKEIQIHGPVEFKRDIERVYIHREDMARNPKCMDQVKEFCENNNLEYEVFGKVSKILVQPKVNANQGVAKVKVGILGVVNMITGIIGGGNVGTMNIGSGNVGVFGNGSNGLNGVGGPNGAGSFNIVGGGVIKTAKKQVVNVVKDQKKERKQKSVKKDDKA